MAHNTRQINRALLCSQEDTDNRKVLPLRMFSLCVSVSLWLFGGFWFSAQAAEVRILTLDQALAIADRQNFDILKAREFSRQVEGKYVEERAAALPQLTVAGSYLRQQDESQKAFLGGTFRTREERRSAEIDLSQTLFTWGKVGAAMRAARKGFATADQRLRDARQETRRSVSAAFYDILLAGEERAIAVQNLEQKERHLEEAKRRHTSGVATDYDVLAASVAVENARPEVIRTTNQVRSARDRLRFFLAIDDDVDAVGTLATAPDPLPSYDEAIATARKRRPGLAELRLRKEIADELVTVADADDKPRLDLRGGYGWRKLEAADLAGDGEVWSVGLFFSFPVFDGLRTRGKVAQAQSERRSLEIDELRLAELISLEIRDAVSAVRQAEETVNSLASTVTQAERLLAIAEQGYELGVKIRLEVDDAQLNLLQARGNLARARRNYLVARVNLERAMGVLGEGPPEP
jgi:hydrophobic/amphiphilic exporter-1 (mainly G- bacteria), HAE1 family